MKGSKYFFNLSMPTHLELQFFFIFTFSPFPSFSLLPFYLFPQSFYTKKNDRVCDQATIPKRNNAQRKEEIRSENREKIGLRFQICGRGRLNKRVFWSFLQDFIKTHLSFPLSLLISFIFINIKGYELRIYPYLFSPPKPTLHSFSTYT